MKKQFLIIVLCGLCTLVNAQGMLRTIIFADNNDDRIGEGVQCNMEQIIEEIDIIAACIDMTDRCATPLVFEQFNCNPQNMRNCINNFKCGKDDIVLFFYFGHGGRSPQDRSDFPQMCLGTDFSQNSQWIPLEDVKDAIEKQNPRFLLVFGDLCNSSDLGITPKYGVLTSAASATDIAQKQKEAMKKLFLYSKGTVIASGSEKNEFSWYLNSYPDGYGFFTNIFIQELESYTTSTDNPNWDTLMERVRNGVISFSSELRAQDTRPENERITVQRPQSKRNITYINNNLVVEEKTEENKQITKKNETLVVNDKIEDNSDLKSMLVDLVNKENSPMTRIRKRSDVLALFANPKVWVDMVGRNHTTVVSGAYASDFVERLSTAPYLKNFSIVDCQRDNNGKITSLKIHEIYER